jgi:hypothetical protein
MMKHIARGDFITHTENHTLSHVAYSFFEGVVVVAYTKNSNNFSHSFSGRGRHRGNSGFLLKLVLPQM